MLNLVLRPLRHATLCLMEKKIYVQSLGLERMNKHVLRSEEKWPKVHKWSAPWVPQNSKVQSRHLPLLGHVYCHISENGGFAAAGWTDEHGGTIGTIQQILGFVPQAQIASDQTRSNQTSRDIRHSQNIRVTVGCRALGASMCFPQ